MNTAYLNKCFAYNFWRICSVACVCCCCCCCFVFILHRVQTERHFKRSIHIILYLSILRSDVDVNVNMSTGQIYGRKWFNTLTRAQSTLAFLINVYNTRETCCFAIFLTFNKFSECVHEYVCVFEVMHCASFFERKEKKRNVCDSPCAMRSHTHAYTTKWSEHGTV